MNQNKIEFEVTKIKSDKNCYNLDKKNVQFVLENLEDESFRMDKYIRNYNVSQPKLDDIFFKVVKNNEEFNVGQQTNIEYDTSNV